MRSELRPLSLGEVLDRTFQIYRSFLLPFVTTAVIGAALGTLWGIVQIFMQRSIGPRSHSGVSAVLLPIIQVIGIPVAVFVYSLVSAAMALAVGSVYQQKPWTAGSVLRTALSRWPTLLGLGVSVVVLCSGLIFLFAGALGAVVVLAPRMASLRGAGALTAVYSAVGIGLFIAVPLCLWLGLRYSLAFPVCSFERASVRQSLRRSVLLTQGMRWRILALTLIYVVVATILSSMLVVPVTVMAARSIAHQPLWYVVFGLVIGFATRALTLPIFGIGMAVFYFDARVRKEGLDVEWSMADAEPQPQPPAPLAPGESPALG